MLTTVCCLIGNMVIINMPRRLQSTFHQILIRRGVIGEGLDSLQSLNNLRHFVLVLSEWTKSVLNVLWHCCFHVRDFFFSNPCIFCPQQHEIIHCEVSRNINEPQRSTTQTAFPSPLEELVATFYGEDQFCNHDHRLIRDFTDGTEILFIEKV